ncbi:MAG: 16S rRNA (cytidine(1402)-2'-O)-methyltransferase [Pseudomonadales bacterium]|nr:16S rRNA (cytidine(1402)-2'-O)-methyltransferase [Pseudomonadales bacterium]
MLQSRAGDLYVVATPIGNLADMTQRAVDVLRDADIVAAEDTRVTARLLSAFDINGKPVVACHDHNEDVVARDIVDRLAQGASVALVSDAGTPLISDPGYRVVNAVIEAGLRVIPIPGPSAAMAALSVAGMTTDRFMFCGFLPTKKVARRSYLSELPFSTMTVVIYEAPHRVMETLIDLCGVVGDNARVTLCRELTKQYEQIWRGDALKAVEAVDSGIVPVRGEFVLLISAPNVTDSLSADDRRLLEVLLAELPPSRAARVASELTGLDRRVFYELAMDMKVKNH